MGSKHRRTVSTFESCYGTGDDSAIGSIGLVVNVAEIGVVAKEAGIGTRASESSEQAARADLATGKKRGNRSRWERATYSC